MTITRPGQRPLVKSTGVLIDAPSPAQRADQKRLAQEVFLTESARLVRARYALPGAHPAITFAAFADWYDTHRISKHRGAERERELLVQLRATFGPKTLAEIARSAVDEYLTTRASGTDAASASTANREVDLLKAMLQAAVPDYLEASPIAGMKRLRTIPRPKRVLSAAEEQRILKRMAPADQALFLAGIDTLVRLGDLLDLRRQDDHRTFLTLQDSKTGPYQVPVSTRLRAALDALPKRGEYYFAHRRYAATERDRRKGVRQMLQRACKRARVKYGRAKAGVTWHTGTRASGATRMLQKGVDPKTVQEIGHWASLEQMGQYLQTSMRLKQAAVNLIGEVPPARSASVVRGNGQMRKGEETRGQDGGRNPAKSRGKKA